MRNMTGMTYASLQIALQEVTFSEAGRSGSLQRSFIRNDVYPSDGLSLRLWSDLADACQLPCIRYVLRWFMS